jgi:hypothetical protein
MKLTWWDKRTIERVSMFLGGATMVVEEDAMVNNN